MKKWEVENFSAEGTNLENDENEETLRLNNIDTSHDNAGRRGGSSQAASMKDDDQASVNTVKQKCANLKRAISDQNQKSLVGLKKSFGLSSPQSLSIEKFNMKSSVLGKISEDVEKIDEMNESCLDADQIETG
jgi:hypothetical protein